MKDGGEIGGHTLVMRSLVPPHARGFTLEQAQELINPETVPSMDMRRIVDDLALLTGLAAEMRDPAPGATIGIQV